MSGTRKNPSWCFLLCFGVSHNVGSLFGISLQSTNQGCQKETNKTRPNEAQLNRHYDAAKAFVAVSDLCTTRFEAISWLLFHFGESKTAVFWVPVACRSMFEIGTHTTCFDHLWIQLGKEVA